MKKILVFIILSIFLMGCQEGIEKNNDQATVSDQPDVDIEIETETETETPKATVTVEQIPLDENESIDTGLSGEEYQDADQESGFNEDVFELPPTNVDDELVDAPDENRDEELESAAIESLKSLAKEECQNLEDESLKQECLESL
ncbi:hypothetical protein GF376_02990 [Candidatus Peregrinibacteria bacterium]|nr:hypothetical protein [Candidatus Peregrinibacteria bacterium]